MFDQQFYWQTYDAWMNDANILNWVSSATFIEHLIKFDRPLTVAEVGVAFGTNLIYMLSKVPNIEKYYAVDQWEGYQDYGPDCPWGNMNGTMMNNVGEKFKSNIDSCPWKNKINVIKQPSELGHNFIPDNSLDWIFIDANHSIDSVRQDCLSYWNKVKKGGIFGGHDWYGGETTVQQGIFQFCQIMNIPKTDIVQMYDPAHPEIPSCWAIFK